MKKTIEVAAAVIVKDRKVFAARRRQGSHLAGYWEFPGGKIEQGETPEECLRRELQEELCITTRIGRFIGESLYDYGAKIVRLIVYEAEHISGSVELVDHDEFCWLAVENLNELNWAPADIPILERLCDLYYPQGNSTL